MLAYVFRHWPVADVARGEYQARLVAFHQALARARVPGFRGSVVFRVTGAPGMAPRQAGYEDWYLIDGSAALDPLNEAAVSGARSGPHDAAARLAADGHGSLYRLRGGEPAVAAARVALWFAKPDGIAHPTLLERLGPSLGAGRGLWGRQMTLGPRPEFGLLAPAHTPLPAELAVRRVRLEPLWG